MTRLQWCACVCATITLLCNSAHASTRYDPRFRFRTITTPHFAIHFHQGEDALARRLARIAEEVARSVAGELGVANGRVHVILVDQTDLSNGWARAAPYNVIEITAAAPPGESVIGNTDDWLRLVFSHEYTHIVHLDKAGGVIGGLRRVFGRMPLLYPNLFLPLWQIEGIATYNESVLTGEGRVPAGDFRMIVDRAASARRFDPLDRANGGLVDWPGGAAQYAYGAYFHQYLAERFGADSIQRLSDETSRRLPYFGARAFRKVYGRSLGALWDDFEAETRRLARPEQPLRTRLTHHGYSVDAPRFSGDGRLFYTVANPHGFPALMELPRDGSGPRQVVTKYLGGHIAATGTSLVFDQLEVVNNVGLHGDLYRVPQDGGRAQRITRGARAADPDVSPDGRTIVCTIQLADRRALATLAVAAGRGTRPAVLISDESSDFASPRWSPDGRSIVAERRRLGHPSELVIVDAATARTRTIVSSPAARNVTPTWTSDAKSILFASDRGGAPFAIYSADVQTGALRRLEGTGVGAQSPALSPDGRDLVFVGYTEAGYDLFSMPIASATWTDVPPQSAPVTTDQSVAMEAGPPAADHPYRPWRMLAPQFWTPIVESDDGEITVGAGVEGDDALGRHVYGAAAAWSASRLRPDWSIGYAYDRWWPTFFASVSDRTDPARAGEVRTREANAGALFPIRRVRWRQSVLAELSGSDDAFDCSACEPSAAARIKRGAVRLGWNFDSAQSYGYSISRESGALLHVTTESTRRALGSSGNAGAFTVDARGFRSVFPRHGVLAARAATAAAWGDDSVRRTFNASGPGPASGGFAFGDDAVGLLRGFSSNRISGSRVAVVNVDYRFPLASIQRGVGTLPFFARTAHAAIFADAGSAWTQTFRRSEIRRSFGAELSIDTVIGYALPLTFTTGAAWRDDPVAARRGFVTFGRIGRAF